MDYWIQICNIVMWMQHVGIHVWIAGIYRYVMCREMSVHPHMLIDVGLVKV